MVTGSMSEKEYLERLGGLYEKIIGEMPDATDQEIAVRYQKLEYDLMIDFRLGEDFPTERRQALHNLQKLILVRMGELSSSMLAGEIAANDFVEAVQQLAGQMKSDFEKLLNPEELEALCGDGVPGIPLDPGLITLSRAR